MDVHGGVLLGVRGNNFLHWTEFNLNPTRIAAENST